MMSIKTVIAVAGSLIIATAANAKTVKMGYTGEASLQKGALACVEMKDFLVIYFVALTGEVAALSEAIEDSATCSFTARSRTVRVILATEQVATVEQGGTEFKVLREDLAVGR